MCTTPSDNFTLDNTALYSHPIDRTFVSEFVDFMRLTNDRANPFFGG